MNNPSENKIQSNLSEIASELRIIRKLSTALLIGIAVLLVTLLNPDIAILIVIAGTLSWLFLSLSCALLNRAKRKRLEAMRLQELSGRSMPLR